MIDQDRLKRIVEQICKKHDLPVARGIAAFSELIIGLDETRRKAHTQHGGILQQAYLVLGREACFHLAGLLEARDGDGIYFEELKYMDSALSEFNVTLERWERELNQEVAANHHGHP